MSIKLLSCNEYLQSFLYFRKPPGKDIKSIIKEVSERMSKTRKDELYVCRFCQNKITRPENITSISGSHSHNFKNPSGIIYEIGCFNEAEGCDNLGTATLEFTWFPGFEWSIAICASCHVHLGWFFQSGERSFYGLILDRLIKS